MTDDPIPDWTPEQKRAIYDAMKAKFTADDLYGYIEGTEPVVPLDDVIAEMEETLRRAESSPREPG